MRNVIQNAFNAGEISPEMWGREDSPSYQQGCRTLENFIVQPLGGVTRRPGTKFEFAVKSATKPTKVFPFSYRDERHQIEIGEDYLRIWEQNPTTGAWTVQQDEGFELPRIVDGAAWSHWEDDGWANSNLTFDISLERFPLRRWMGPFQITTTASAIPGGLSLLTDYWVFVHLQQSFTPVEVQRNKPVRLGFCESWEKSREVDSDGNWVPDQVLLTTDDIGTGTGQHMLKMSTTDNEYEFRTLWQDADIPNLRAKQVDNKMYLYDGNHGLWVLERLDFSGGNTSNVDGGGDPNASEFWTKPKWTIDEVPFTEGPWKVESSWTEEHEQWISLKIIAPVGGISYIESHPEDHEAELTPIPEDYQLHKEANDGTLYDILFGHDPDDVTDFLLATLRWTHEGATPASYNQIHQFAGPTTPREVECSHWAYGFLFREQGPSAVGWHDNRLLLSGGYSPNETHLSSLVHPWHYLPVNHDGSIDEETAFKFDIGGDEDNAVVAYAELRDLLIFSGDGVWAANSQSGVEGINLTSIALRQIATVGCSSLIEPIRMQQAVAYLSRTGKRLRLIQYSNDVKDYRSFDLLDQHEHILESGAAGLAYQDEPHDKVWVVRQDGTMASVTLQGENGVIGAARHSLGGTAPSVQTAWTLPSADADADNLYMVVQRTVDGSPAQFVERLGTPVKLGASYSTDNTKSDAYHLDCGMTFTGSVSSFTMAHLPNETVDVMTDGVYYGEVTLNGSGESGALTGAPFSTVHAGYTYTSELEPMPPAYGTQGGTTAGSTMKIMNTSLRLHGTIGGSCGDRVDESTDADGHSVLGVIDYPNPGELFSGNILVQPEIDHSTQPTIVYRQAKPYPATVNAVLYRLDGTMKGDSEGRETHD